MCHPYTRQSAPAAPPPSPPPAASTEVSVPLVPPPKTLSADKELAHIKLARSYIGTAETKGAKHNPKIIELRTAARTGIKNDDDAWCSDFHCGVLEKSGHVSARSAASRANLNWGQKLAGPAYGATVVFWRGSRSGWQGHVGFVVGRDRHGNLMVLGGNQSDAVNIKPFSVSRVLGYRWPKELELPKAIGMKTLPLLTSDGRVSTNEA